MIDGGPGVPSVLLKILLVRGVEVTGHNLSLHGVHKWGTWLNSFGTTGAGGHQSEVFEVLAVRCLETKGLRLVIFNFEKAGSSSFSVSSTVNFLLPLQLLQLRVGKVLLVSRLSSEGQTVVRVLRVFLMEDISFTVVPVGETGLVGAHLNDRCGLFFGLAVLGLRAKTLLALVGGAVSGCQVHAVRVDYLSFLLQVKGVLVVLNLGIINLSVVVLPVVGVENLGVGVLDETVSASRVAHTFVPNGKLLERSSLFPDTVAGLLTVSTFVLPELSVIILLHLLLLGRICQVGVRSGRPLHVLSRLSSNCL